MDRKLRGRVLLMTFLAAASAAMIAADAVAAPTAAPAARPAATSSFDALVARQTLADQKLKPDQRSKLLAAGKEVRRRMDQPVAAGAKPKTALEVGREVAKQNVSVLGTLTGGDIEELCFLILMEATNSAQKDLTAMMASVKAINRSKAQLREELEKLKSHQDAGADLADLSEAQQLQMQTYLDRMSKFEEALSNVLKKISDTQTAIIFNLK